MKTNLIPLALAASVGLFTSCAKDELIAPATATATTKDMPLEGCSQTIEAMIGTQFMLTWLNGYAVQIAPGAERPWMKMTYDRGSVLEGRTGCNEMFGRFEINCDALEFSDISSTRMLCTEVVEVEQEFLQALSEITTYVFDGRELQLVRGHTVLMKLTTARPSTADPQNS